MRYFLLTLSVVICLLAACDKKPKAPAAGAVDMLRGGKWKLASGTVTMSLPNGKDTTLDYMKFIPQCYKDDYLVFDSLNGGKRYTGGTTCSAADPDFFSFFWQLKGNNNLLDLYSGFNYIYGIIDSVQPFALDTISVSPEVYDTIIGMLDTPVPPKVFIQLDTIKKLNFYGVPAGVGETGHSMGGYDIYAADLYNLSSSTFTIHFQMHTYRMDTTMWHSATFLLPIDHVPPPDYDYNPGEYPILPYYKRDTIDYILNFTN